MRFAILASGSAGNALLIETSESRILVDCGLSAKQLNRRLDALGAAGEKLDAVLLSHEHDDHVAGARTVARQHQAPIYASYGTGWALRSQWPDTAIETLQQGSTKSFGAISVEPIIVPHDAREPYMFVFSAGSSRLGLLTDVGMPTEHIQQRFKELDSLILEFNHDASMLEASVYPRSLKNRIGGPYGHLSNDQARQILASLDATNLSSITAAHLSEKNNDPKLVEDLLAQYSPAGCRNFVAEQHSSSDWVDVQSNRN
ncbi:MAG: MBL fold metallo-hydrolase [Pseudomonadota bacterium]